MKEQYKEIKTYLGVIQITNKNNGKFFINSYPNLKNKWMTIQWQLDMGKFANAELQKDWNELGSDAFLYEILEQKDAEKVLDKRWELKKLKRKWLNKLQPYGHRGYNAEPRD